MDRRTSRLAMIAGLVLIVGIVAVAWVLAR
jgi:hypothetical protein